MKTCLIDSSSAILLYKSGLIQTLISTFDVRVGTVVYKELTCSGYPGCEHFKKIFKGKQLELRKKKDGEYCPYFMITAALDPGERQTLLLFQDMADFIIVDDGSAVRCCRKLGIPHINALLMPRIFCMEGKISREACRQKMRQLTEIGRYSPYVIDYAWRCVASRLIFFCPEEVRKEVGTRK
ncbi:MAG: hypothetical protein U9R66_12705 [Thermodesulfobacteriota bacterium]|nr:hypothetical protein [Thermodesulfobacteriota bacterium]